MKKAFILLFVISVVVTLILSGSGCAKQETVKLLMASQLNLTDISAQHMEKFGKELEEFSNGRVEVEFSFAGVMGGATDMYDLVSSQVSDITSFMPSMEPGLFPVSEAIGLPWAFDNAVVSYKMLKALWEAGYLDEEYANLHVVGMMASGPETFYTVDTPLTKVASAKGLKLRAPGTNQLLKIEALGGTPVSMPMSEMYLAAEKGIIDGAITAWTAVPALRLYEVFHYATEPGFGAAPGVMVFNKNSYAKLPADIQQYIDQIGWQHYLELSTDIKNKFNDYKKEWVDQGCEIVQWDSQDMQNLFNALTPIWSDWISTMEAKGKPAKAILDVMYSAAKKEGITNPAIGYSP